MTARFVDLFRSHNRLTVAVGTSRMPSLLQEIGTLASAEVDSTGSLEVPYVCRAYVARRRDCRVQTLPSL